MWSSSTLNGYYKTNCLSAVKLYYYRYGIYTLCYYIVLLALGTLYSYESWPIQWEKLFELITYSKLSYASIY